jgi:hypothetical protein
MVPVARSFHFRQEIGEYEIISGTGPPPPPLRAPNSAGSVHARGWCIFDAPRVKPPMTLTVCHSPEDNRASFFRVVIRNLFAGMWWVMVSVAALVGAATSLPCEQARMRCAYRVGCGMALQNYVVGCSGVLQGPPPTQCPEICHHSLIALTSTEEGKDLMNVSTTFSSFFPKSFPQLQTFTRNQENPTFLTTSTSNQPKRYFSAIIQDIYLSFSISVSILFFYDQ